MTTTTSSSRSVTSDERPVLDDNRLCGAQTRSGGACRRPAGWGTGHVGAGTCKLHSGRSRSGEVAGRRALARRLLADLGVLGVPVATDPVSALEGLLDEANGNVIALRDLVRSLDCGTSDGKDTETLVSRFGRHPFVEMYDAERDRLGKIAKECAALGLEERRIHVAERESRALEAVLARVFDVLGLDTGQRARAGEVAAAELRAITVTPTARSAFELEARAS